MDICCFLLAQQSVSPPNRFEIAAWQAAVVGSALASFQLSLGPVKQHRDNRRERAKLGYELLDSLFSDESASDFLYALDSPRPSQSRVARRKVSLTEDYVALVRNN